MSGSDGPSGGGMWTGGPQSDDCASLRIDDGVAAPDASFPFRAGIRFDVVFNPGPPSTISLEFEHRRVGALHPYPALVRCLNAGVPFRAEVRSVSGGDIRVAVEPEL